MKETNLKKAATLTVSVAGLAVGVGLVAREDGNFSVTIRFSCGSGAGG